MRRKMSEGMSKKHGETLSPKPRRRVSIMKVTARMNRINGYKVMKRFQRAAEPVEQFFVVRIYSGKEIFRRADFVNMARLLKALAPHEYMTD
jgi:hypothetical protein